jgi:hypothetical protein
MIVYLKNVIIYCTYPFFTYYACLYLDISGEVAGDVLPAGGGVGEGGVGEWLTVGSQGLPIRTAEPVDVRLYNSSECLFCLLAY